MPGAELVSHIRIDAMDALRSEEKPVLAACIRDDLDYHTTLEGLETVAIYAGPALRICVILEDLLPFFESRYGVTGTPTFLLLQGGELKIPSWERAPSRHSWTLSCPLTREKQRTAHAGQKTPERHSLRQAGKDRTT
jgi:hypothetical protein